MMDCCPQMSHVCEAAFRGAVTPTYDEEEQEAEDEEGRAADGHAIGEFDEGRQQQRGPEQEVEQRPGAARGDDGGAGEAAFPVVVFLEGVLRRAQGNTQQAV